MFMTPALTSVNRETDSGFGLMHLNALNGSASISSDSCFGPRNYVNDEHVSATFFENFKYNPKDSLKSPSLRRSKTSSPLPASSRSSARSPYLSRHATKTNKYEVEVHGVCDETTERNLLKNNFTKNKLEVSDCYLRPDRDFRLLKKKSTSADVKVTKSLNFDSLSLSSSPCKENKKSSKRVHTKHNRSQTN